MPRNLRNGDVRDRQAVETVGSKILVLKRRRNGSADYEPTGKGRSPIGILKPRGHDCVDWKRTRNDAVNLGRQRLREFENDD